MMDSRDVFDHIKLGGNFTDIPADSLAEWLTNSAVYITQFGAQQEAEHELECYDLYVVRTLEYASEVLCHAGMYPEGLDMLRRVVAYIWEDTHVSEYDVDYGILEAKLALVIRKLTGLYLRLR